MATGGVYSCTVPFIILKGSSSLIILSDGTLYVEPTTELLNIGTPSFFLYSG